MKKSFHFFRFLLTVCILIFCFAAWNAEAMEKYLKGSPDDSDALFAKEKLFKGTITAHNSSGLDTFHPGIGACPGGRGYMGEIEIPYMIGTYLGEPVCKYGFSWNWVNEYSFIDDERSIRLSDLKKYPDLYERFIAMRPINVYLTVTMFFYQDGMPDPFCAAELPIGYHELLVGRAGEEHGELIPGSPKWDEFFKITSSGKFFYGKDLHQIDKNNKSVFMAADKIVLRDPMIVRIEWASADGIIHDYLSREKEEKEDEEKKVEEEQDVDQKQKGSLLKAAKEEQNAKSKGSLLKQKNSSNGSLLKDAHAGLPDKNAVMGSKENPLARDARIAREKEEAERKAKALEEKLAREKAEAEKKALEEKLAQEKAEAEKKSIQGGNFSISLGNGVTLDMIWIEPGVFIMGSPEDERGRSNGETQHQVTLTSGYWLGRYEVTQAQYQTIMGTNPSYFKGADLPVEKVSWNGAMDFCAKLTEMEREAGRLPKGYVYTLPTEAQWEYACRAGTTTALNSGKNLSDKYKCPYMDEVGWYWYNSGKITHPVGQKQPNAWGLYDMHGNVWEWCLDRYGKNYYKESPSTDPLGPDKGSYRVYRGGGWYYYARDCRSANRDDDVPGFRYYDYGGFRVCLSYSSDP